MKTTKNNEKIITNFIKAKSKLNSLNLSHLFDEWLKVELSIFYRTAKPNIIVYFYKTNDITVKIEFYDKFCTIQHNIGKPYQYSTYKYLDIDVIIGELEIIIKKIKGFNQ